MDCKKTMVCADAKRLCATHARCYQEPGFRPWIFLSVPTGKGKGNIRLTILTYVFPFPDVVRTTVNCACPNREHRCARCCKHHLKDLPVGLLHSRDHVWFSKRRRKSINKPSITTTWQSADYAVRSDKLQALPWTIFDSSSRAVTNISTWRRIVSWTK